MCVRSPGLMKWALIHSIMRFISQVPIADELVGGTQKLKFCLADLATNKEEIEHTETIRDKQELLQEQVQGEDGPPAAEDGGSPDRVQNGESPHLFAVIEQY